MTNVNADQANNTGLPKAGRMTREQLQNEALVIKSMLSAAMAAFNSEISDTKYSLIEMAHDHANKLNEALDVVNSPEVSA